MNGAQDLGGMMGFGAIIGEPEHVPFHADWEKRALAITLAVGALGQWNLDMTRHARETLNPADYLSSSYFEIWIKGLEKLLVASGLVTAEELVAGKSLIPAKKVRRALQAGEVSSLLAKGTASDHPVGASARFSIGDRVRAKLINPTGHTRLPRYVRGRVGTIERVHGAFVFPDTKAHGWGECPDWVYSVRFTGGELWGREGDPDLAVSVDAWQSYLEGVES